VAVGGAGGGGGRVVGGADDVAECAFVVVVVAAAAARSRDKQMTDAATVAKSATESCWSVTIGTMFCT